MKRTLDISNAENQIDFTLILESQDHLQCYCALGVINTGFSPVPRTIRDFIANPKNNGYRSLHVRINYLGQSFLIKIRTPEMDHWAQYGILAEWDAQKPLSDEHWQEASELLRQIGEYGGAGRQRKALIRLSEAEEIFAYTPKGDIHYLPKGSIVLDFAYKIHSELGDHCEGAYVNGEWASPMHRLKDGDIVEIITTDESLDVQPEYEEMCKTPKARTAINKRLQQRRLRHAEEIGRQIILQEVSRHELAADVLESENTHYILEFLNLKDLTDLYVRLGQDLLSPHLVLYYLESPRQSRTRAQSYDSPASTPFERNSILINELDKAVHKFARCCNPLPGQGQVVATLSERGATFHHAGCRGLLDRHDLQPQQLVDVIWNKNASWRNAAVFQFHVIGESPASVVPLLASVRPHTQILSIEFAIDRHEHPMTRISVRFRNFGDADDIFNLLPPGKTVIEDYGREGGARTVQLERSSLPI
jgi:GTP pyrophosphokinase